MPRYHAGLPASADGNTGLSLSPTTFSLDDMHGNVYEWHSGWYSKGNYSVSPEKAPRDSRKGGFAPSAGVAEKQSGVCVARVSAITISAIYIQSRSRRGGARIMDFGCVARWPRPEKNDGKTNNEFRKNDEPPISNVQKTCSALLRWRPCLFDRNRESGPRLAAIPRARWTGGLRCQGPSGEVEQR